MISVQTTKLISDFDRCKLYEKKICAIQKKEAPKKGAPLDVLLTNPYPKKLLLDKF
jgi:hypothetical protein